MLGRSCGRLAMSTFWFGWQCPPSSLVFLFTFLCKRPKDPNVLLQEVMLVSVVIVGIRGTQLAAFTVGIVTIVLAAFAHSGGQMANSCR